MNKVLGLYPLVSGRTMSVERILKQAGDRVLVSAWIGTMRTGYTHREIIINTRTNKIRIKRHPWEANWKVLESG